MNENNILHNTDKSKLSFYVGAIQKTMTAQKVGTGSIGNLTNGFNFFSIGYAFQNYFDLSNINKVLKLESAVMAATDCENVRSYQSGRWLNFEFERLTKRDCLFSNLKQDSAIGAIDDKRLVEFDFSESVPHTGLFGTTGSGKTFGAISILLSVIKRYSPDQLKIILIDKNAWFNKFANLAHLSLPIARTDSEIESAISYAYNLLIHRQQNDIKKDYRQLLVIDEAYTLLSENKKLKMLVEYIANNGRAFNVNLIIITQDKGFDSKAFGSILSKVNRRYVGMVENHHLSNSLCGLPGVFCNKLTGAGDFVEVLKNKTQRFQFALTVESDYVNLPRGEVNSVAVAIPETIVESKIVGRPRIEYDLKIIGRLMRMMFKSKFVHSFRKTPIEYESIYKESLTRTQLNVNFEALNIILRELRK